MIPNVLSIAGTDPIGGAGIQADLKAFSALGAYGMAVVTAVVAQNTHGVRCYEAVRPSLVADQINAVFDDVQVHAVKIGMLANPAIIEVVADRLRYHSAPNIILDPVMIAKSGDALLSDDAIDAIRLKLVPIATLITPNLPEAAMLLGIDEPFDTQTMQRVAQSLRELGSQWVLVKGGHLSGPIAVDVLVGPNSLQQMEAPKVSTTSDHGTGCTLSSAIAALLPNSDVPSAARRAKQYLTAALQNASRLHVGKPGGRGPVHHFHEWW